MGIDYSASLCVGFVVDKDDLEKMFTEELEETFVFEKFFDSKTGERMSDRKRVVREAGRYLKSEVCPDDQKRLLECDSDMLENIAEMLGINLTPTYWNAEEEEVGDDIVVSPVLSQEVSKALFGAETITLQRLFSEKWQPFETLMKQLDEWGIPHGELAVHVVLCAC